MSVPHYSQFDLPCFKPGLVKGGETCARLISLRKPS